MENKNIYDVCVIGGGPAGIMAAISAAEEDKKVVLVEKNKELAKKLLLTGGGRCNITNAEFDLKKLVENYNNGEFLYHAFSVFGPKETIEFFKKIGIDTKIENNKRVFTKDNNAKKVLEQLLKYLDKNDINIIFNSEIIDIKNKEKKIEKIILNNREVVAKNFILCTGGKSYSITGSNGFGYELAKKIGHKIIELKPALAPIILKENFVKDLQAISLRNIKLTIIQNNKKYFSEEGEIIFTNSGISGPAVLNISSKINNLLEKGEVKIYLDFFPKMNHEEVLKEFENITRKYSSRTIKNILSLLMQERMAEIMLYVIGINKEKIANNISKLERNKIVNNLKGFILSISEISGFDNAMTTKGGIDLNEIDHKTMRSKIINNLSFAGEIINIDGKTGGFNLQMCWTTGYIAGKNI